MDIVLTAAPASSSRELIPADSHIARCIELISIGTVTKEFEGKSKTLQQLRITWELPELMHEYDGKQEPARIGQTFTASLHEKSGLRKVLKSWRGKDFTEEELKGFSLRTILGAPCLLTISHTEKGGKTYANVDAVTKLHKSMVCPEQISPLKLLAYGEDFDFDLFESLPNFLKDQIRSTPEFKALKQPAAAPAATAPAASAPADKGDDENELPF